MPRGEMEASELLQPGEGPAGARTCGTEDELGNVVKSQLHRSSHPAVLDLRMFQTSWDPMMVVGQRQDNH